MQNLLIKVTLLAVVLCTGVLAQETREWTNRKGQKMQGTYVSHDSTHVKIRKNNGDVKSVKITILSEADQDYVDSVQDEEEPEAPTPEPLKSPTESEQEKWTFSDGLLGDMSMSIGMITITTSGVFIAGLLLLSGCFYLAAKIMSFEGTWKRAIGAAFLVEFLLVMSQIFLGLVLPFSPSSLTRDPAVFRIIFLVVTALFGGFGVQVAYRETLGRSIVACFISLVFFLMSAGVILVITLIASLARFVMG